MGFDVDRFESSVNDGLLCCICRDVLEDPVQAPCEHAFCASCISAWLVHESSCPEDRQILLDTELRPLFRYMKNDLDRLRLRCRNAGQGCDHVCSLEFVRSHEAECPFEPVICPNSGCTVRVLRQELRDHLSQCSQSGPSGSPRDEAHQEVMETVGEMRAHMEMMKADFVCKLDDQRQEMDLRLEAQRRHLVQRESNLQFQIDELRSQNGRLQQEMKQLLDMEKGHRKELEQMRAEKRELLLVLKQLQKESRGTQDHTCVRCNRNEKVTAL